MSSARSDHKRKRREQAKANRKAAKAERAAKRQKLEDSNDDNSADDDAVACNAQHSQIDAAALKETEYVLHGGMRHVKPYPFVFTSSAKRRWLGRSILDVYSQEFVSFTREYYVRLLSSFCLQALTRGTRAGRGDRARSHYRVRQQGRSVARVARWRRARASHAPPRTCRQVRLTARSRFRA